MAKQTFMNACGQEAAIMDLAEGLQDMPDMLAAAFRGTPDTQNRCLQAPPRSA